MNRNKFLKTLSATCISTFLISCGQKKRQKPLRLLYWNIQNGMWCGQDDNYVKFTTWVKQQEPDICVWCEAQSIYKNGTANPLEIQERFLVDNWNILAKRYGHSYWYIGGHRDNYPQVITSKYPIENIKKIVGKEPNQVITHGAGWARIIVDEKVLNIVTLHTWPQPWAFRSKNQEASKAENGGDKYRLMEIEYICKHTIGTCKNAINEYWMMVGDFNSRNRIDNAIYKYPENSSIFLVQDYISKKTPYVDIIAKKYPNEFKTTTGKEARIDYVFCTPPLYNTIYYADVITDNYTKPVRDPNTLSNFWWPSDHRPILIYFDLNKLK